jgi:predicted nucleic acid-binding protein
MVLAHRLRRPTTYDCHYLALAEHYGCELWTGDERFFNAVRRQIPWIRWVGAGTAP